MFTLRVISCIQTDKYLEFIEKVSGLSPEPPVSFFHVHEESSERHLLNLIAECNRLEPLTDYIRTERFKTVVAVINELGSLEGIKMEKYSESSLN